MNDAQAKQLREPFPEGMIGKLPKPKSKDAPKGTCPECGKYHGLPAVHLDYVGHAATTDRLLQVDPAWTWEPAAVGPNGEPLMTNGGLWIKLTVAGVTRYGFGDGASVKECIGDAIRNAAMRFGVALDLWAKEDLHATDEGSPAVVSPDSAAGEGGGGRPTAPAATPPSYPKREAKLLELVKKKADEKAVENTRNSLETARGQGEAKLDAWLTKATEHWEQESEFQVPASARSAA